MFGALSFALSVVFGRPRLETHTWCLCEGGGMGRDGEEEGNFQLYAGEME